MPTVDELTDVAKAADVRLAERQAEYDTALRELAVAQDDRWSAWRDVSILRRT